MGRVETFVVKLVPWNSPVIQFNRDVLQYFLDAPFPDGKYVYRGISWEDTNGVLILMEPYDVSLSNRISLSVQFAEREWCTIMLGIVNHLSFPHASGIAHGYLRSEKGFPN
jgi:hypothetical protein